MRRTGRRIRRMPGSESSGSVGEGASVVHRSLSAMGAPSHSGPAPRAAWGQWASGCGPCSPPAPLRRNAGSAWRVPRQAVFCGAPPTPPQAGGLPAATLTLHRRLDPTGAATPTCPPSRGTLRAAPPDPHGSPGRRRPARVDRTTVQRDDATAPDGRWDDAGWRGAIARGETALPRGRVRAIPDAGSGSPAAPTV